MACWDYFTFTLLSSKYLDFYSDVIWFLQDSVKIVEIYVQMIFWL